MNLRQKVVTRTISVLIVLFISIVVYVSRVDSRLYGKFRSDKEGNLEYWKSTTELSAHKIKNLEQIYGFTTLDIKGHTITFNQEPHTIQDYAKGSSTEVKHVTYKTYFLSLGNIGGKTKLIVFRERFWEISKVELVEVEFDGSGFWLYIPDRILGTKWKEKFAKINYLPS